jgi:uncharacterized protein with NRDE domain
MGTHETSFLNISVDGYDHRDLTPPGIYCISNDKFESDWIKVCKLRTDVTNYLEATETPTAVALLEIMRNAEHEDVRKGSIFRTTRPMDYFGTMVDYGTVSTTICLVDTNGQVSLTERRYPPTQDTWEDTCTTFQIE